jgi:K(+)-stimulated pyrophosphate-energized sodium pump
MHPGSCIHGRLIPKPNGFGGDIMNLLYLSMTSAALALAVAALLAFRVTRQAAHNPYGEEIAAFLPRMREIARAIQEGALAFLRREYSALIPFVVLVTVVLAVFIDPRSAVCYVSGALLSALAGFLGMNIAVRSNWITTAQALRGLDPALRIAFSGGSVMGLTVVGLGILGVALLYALFRDIQVVTAFGFGASSIALFARVGGGIYTKAADVGADLVGKLEAGIPEDDPRNPAVIADNVGDNVGDVAGMGADLFESFVGSIIAAIALAAGVATSRGLNDPYALLPLLIAAAGVVSSVIGILFVRVREGAGFAALLWALRRGIFAASALVILLSWVIVRGLGVSPYAFGAIVVGLLAGVVIGLATEYFTSYSYRPTRYIAEQSQTGPATTILSGLAVGMQSTLIPVLTVSAGIILSFQMGERIQPGFGFYGVAIAAVGMLSTLGITLSTDAYGPIADNAGGIAEQAHLPSQVRERTDALDALGNTTAATGKGFAIGSAALTALALMAAYAHTAQLSSLSILDYRVLTGVIVGAVLPFLFASYALRAVGKAAFAVVHEVRRQFREIPGLMEGTARPDYARCVDLVTRDALREMVLPGTIAVLSPLIVGFLLGREAIGGLLVGSIATGFLLAVMMANAGGAWDNAKKYIEAGHLGGKRSEAHKASVIGDTVGDPFKDTAGPSMNILLKLMAIVSLVFTPLFQRIPPLLGG